MIEVTVSNQQDDHEVDEQAVSLYLGRVAEAVGCTADELSAAFVGPATIRELNRTFRGIDRVTDVLSFALEEGPGPEGRTNLGDLVICASRAAEQAAEAGHSLWTEYRVLLLHGFLHLMGMDHPEGADGPETSSMEAEEQRLRRQLIDQ